MVEQDACRLRKLGNNKKCFADSMILTTTMLKKCVRVPKLYVKDLKEAYQQTVTKEQFEQITARRKKEAFKRGSMMFEDYNYGLYNKYILIDPEHIESDDEIKTMVLKQKSSKNFNDQPTALECTEEHLEKSCTESYTHEALDQRTEEQIARDKERAHVQRKEQ